LQLSNKLLSGIWDGCLTLHQNIEKMGKSKIIVVANQKGGAGKTTLCMLLASFLVDRGESIGAVVDADSQKSIIKKREEDLRIYDGTDLSPQYKVVSYSLANHQQIPAFIKNLRSTGETYIIDTPGGLDNNGIISLLAMADYILCPFDYDSLTLMSTTEFLRYCNNLKRKIKNQTGYEANMHIILVPCRKPKSVGTKCEKILWEAIREKIQSLYTLTPEIPQSGAVRRTDTMTLTPEQLEKAEPALYTIFETIYNPNKPIQNGDNQEEIQ